MFIVFEGIDGSGKTSLSKKFAERYNFEWTKEPAFSSEQADQLNLSESSSDREVEFIIDRILHQSIIKNSTNIICDRYIWSALAYCRVFNLPMYTFVRTIYTNKYFRRPDYYIFVDTPVETCLNRKTPQNMNQLKSLHDAFIYTKSHILKSSKLFKIDASENLETTFKFLENRFTNILK